MFMLLDFNDQDKEKIIRSLLFLKRKRDNTLEARLVADGIMQDRGTGSENSSPTVATKSLFVLAALFAYEKRKVVTVDIVGAFLHGKIKNLVIIEVGSKCAEVMVSVSGYIWRQNF